MSLSGAIPLGLLNQTDGAVQPMLLFKDKINYKAAW
jgi:hypothetical protein